MSHQSKTSADWTLLTPPSLPYALLIGHLRSLLIAHACAVALATALRPLFPLARWFVPTPRPGEGTVWVLAVPPLASCTLPFPFMRLTWSEAVGRWVGQVFYRHPAGEVAPFKSFAPTLEGLKAMRRDGEEPAPGGVLPVREGMHIMVPHHIAAALALSIAMMDLKAAWLHEGSGLPHADPARLAARLASLGLDAEVMAGEPAVLVNGNVLWQLRPGGWTARGLGRGWPQGNEVPWGQGIERLATDLVLEASEGEVVVTGEVADV